MSVSRPLRSYRDQGVVIRTYRLGEADRIVVVLTAEHGKIRAVARGVRKTTSRFGARLEPLSHVALLVHRGRGELDLIIQAERLDPVGELRADLDRLAQGVVLLEAIDQLTPEREPVPQLYRMLVGALRTLASSRSPLVVPAFFLKLLAAEGVGPQLDACVQCGAEAPLVAFDPGGGGVLCRSCRRGMALSPDALALVRSILGGELTAALAEPASPATNQVRDLATEALEHHLERRLRASAALGSH